MTWRFGADPVADAFYVAWMLPNLLRRLFGEGALSAAFIPAYTRLDEGPDGPRRSGRLLAGVSGALVAGLGAVAAAVAGGAWVWTAYGGAEPLVSSLIAILFPYAVLVCWLAILAGAANTHGIFVIPASAPIVLNVVWIVGLVVAGSQISATAGVRTVAVFLVLGGVVQLVLTGIGPLARIQRWRAPGLPDPESRAVLRAMIPAAVGLGVSQINVLFDQLLAFVVLGDGANTYLYLANRLLLFPHALVALPLGVAIFPQLSRIAANLGRQPGADRTLRERLTRATRVTWALAIPAAVGMSLVAEDLIRLVFERGQFQADDTPVAAAATVALVAGLPAVSINALLTRTLFALGAHSRAAQIAVTFAPINLAGNFLALAAGFGVVGLTATTSVCAWVQLLQLERSVHKHLPAAQRPVGILAMTAQTVGSTLAMATAVLVARSAFPRTTASTWVGIATLAVCICTGAAVYMLAQGFCGNKELRTLLGSVRRRFQ